VCVSGGGEGWTALDMETSHASNLLENAARTHHPLHAVLGGFDCARHVGEKDITTIYLK